MRVSVHCVLLGVVWSVLPAAPPGPLPEPGGDVPLKVIEGVSPRYPLRQMQRGTASGEARLRIEVGTDGRLVEWLVTHYTRKDFADEAVRAVQAWRFEPTRVGGEPAVTIVDLDFDFRVDGVLVFERKPGETDLDVRETGFAPASRQQLDQALTPVRTVAPLYPQELGARGVEGRVTVDFFIDESGRVRLPVVTTAPHTLLGASALGAIEQWRFAPPLRNGRPTLVHAKQVFQFVPDQREEG